MLSIKTGTYNGIGLAPTSGSGIATAVGIGIDSQIPYKNGASTTSFLPNGTAGQVLNSAGTSPLFRGGISGRTF